MKLEEIIAMAREIADTLGSRMCDENGETHGEELYAMSLADIQEAVELVAAREREECAKVCDGLQDVPATEPRHCAADIRARSNT